VRNVEIIFCVWRKTRVSTFHLK